MSDKKYAYVFDENGNYTGQKVEVKDEEHSYGLIKTKDGEAIRFEFADPENDPALICSPDKDSPSYKEASDHAQKVQEKNNHKNEKIAERAQEKQEAVEPIMEPGNLIHSVKIITPEIIDAILIECGVYDMEDKSYVEKLEYLKNESRKGKLDLVQTAKKYLGDDIGFESTLFVIENPDGTHTAHNGNNFGNFLWGNVIAALGIPLWTGKLGGHWDAWEKHGELDSDDDQYSIELGYAYFDETLEHQKNSVGVETRKILKVKEAMQNIMDEYDFLQKISGEEINDYDVENMKKKIEKLDELIKEYGHDFICEHFDDEMNRINEIRQDVSNNLQKARNYETTETYSNNAASFQINILNIR